MNFQIPTRQQRLKWSARRLLQHIKIHKASGTWNNEKEVWQKTFYVDEFNTFEELLNEAIDIINKG